jgi:hypothetical protein
VRSVYLDGKDVRAALTPQLLHDDSRLVTDGAHAAIKFRDEA